MSQPARLQASFFGRRGGRVPSAHQQFLDLTCSRYQAMAQRFSERRSRSGHVTQVGRSLPFTLDEYREWLVGLLGAEEGVCNCVYCHAHLTIHTLVVDHRVPPSRGGSLELDNLAISCDPCNQQKGSMSDVCFMALRNFCRQLPQVDADNLLGRLQRATRLAIKVRRYEVQSVKQRQKMGA